ncbi:MAG: GNAT family N-acetyltransferase [Actinobacteria bacterium]|nr:GNAT family N-acetyltransferase [Actinomycetota bacterium]
MPEFHLVEGAPATPWVVGALHHLEQATSLELFGEDRTMSVESLTHNLSTETSALKGLLLALTGPIPAGCEVGRFGLPLAPTEPAEVLGTVSFTLPLRENRHLIEDIYIQVAGPNRRQRIGSAMLDSLREIAAAFERDTLLMWTEHDFAAGSQLPQVSPTTGSGSLPVDAAASFALAHQFRLAQVERQSRLHLPIDPNLLAEFSAAAEAAATGYRLVSWHGPTPQEYLAGVAAANWAISADAPTGGIDWEPENWDERRVRDLDAMLDRSGQAVSTIALVADSGEVAGLTTIFVENGRLDRPYQFNTVVLAAHRGHRLGWWLKAVNLARLEVHYPQAKHIDTWNANENEHMLAINTALGYRIWAISGGWQLKLAAAG